MAAQGRFCTNLGLRTEALCRRAEDSGATAKNRELGAHFYNKSQPSGLVTVAGYGSW